MVKLTDGGCVHLKFLDMILAASCFVYSDSHLMILIMSMHARYFYFYLFIFK